MSSMEIHRLETSGPENGMYRGISIVATLVNQKYNKRIQAVITVIMNMA